ncbi:hypothetical protein SBX64_15000 [Vibrio rhizosphaerae]|uniref:Lipoprotein n=1 Tax=Vibrio rhizosphaerae TaxID=398736 RepID=A0ABU4J003_9VIBR|nr:hypothetical protein [Vibrio rhizosphaerae]MDW6093844.1 hypothetical protein [Vibrio rhizosphaerae]
MTKRLKHMSYCLFCMFMMFNLTGCQDKEVKPEKVLDTVITEYNLPNIVKIVEQRYPELDGEKQSIVQTLEAVHKGRDAYQHYLLAQGRKKEATYLPKQEAYNSIREKMFEQLDDNDITLGKLFNDLDKKKTFIESFHEKNMALYQKVDRENLEIQKQLDQRDNYLKPKLAALNKKVSIKLQTIEWEDDTFYIFFKRTNHSNVPIKRLGLRYILKDQHGINILTVSENITNMHFTGTEHSHFTVSLYDIDKGSDDYQALRHARLNQVTLDYQITKIETAKNTLPNYGTFKSFEHYKNQHYQSPEKLEGKGPYTANELKYQIDKLKAEFDDGINTSTPSLKIYNKLLSRFYESARAFVEKFYQYN